MIQVAESIDFFLLAVARQTILSLPFNSLECYLYQLWILLGEFFLPVHSQKMPLVHKPNNPLIDDVALTFLVVGSMAGVFGLEGSVDHIHVLMDDLAIRWMRDIFSGLLGRLLEVVGSALVYIGVDLQCVVPYFLAGCGLIDLDLHLRHQIVEGIGGKLVGTDDLLAAFFHII